MEETIFTILIGISVCIAIILGILCYTNSQIIELKQQLNSISAEQKNCITNEKFSFNESLRNIEELIDPKPIDCYIDPMCYDVAQYCICQPPEKIITTDLIMRHFCIGYRRSSTILHQLVLRKICRRLQNGGVFAIISIDELYQMAREGKI